ncbi:MAG: hypothetical protein ABR572_05210, partial [Cryomorphaceae bacterium]
ALHHACGALRLASKNSHPDFWLVFKTSATPIEDQAKDMTEGIIADFKDTFYCGSINTLKWLNQKVH